MSPGTVLADNFLGDVGGCGLRLKGTAVNGAKALACEGFFGRLKNEFFHCRTWDNISFEEFVAELGAYIEYYNEERIKQSLGWMSLGLAA